jgi:hypothetical protein
MIVIAAPDAVPFRDASFDGVVSWGLPEGINLRAVTNELARVLRSDGWARLVARNRRDLAAHRTADIGADRVYSWGEFERLLGPVFRITGRRTVGWHGGWKSRLATAAVRLPGLQRFSKAIVVEARPRR